MYVSACIFSGWLDAHYSLQEALVTDVNTYSCRRLYFYDKYHCQERVAY